MKENTKILLFDVSTLSFLSISTFFVSVPIAIIAWILIAWIVVLNLHHFLAEKRDSNERTG